MSAFGTLAHRLFQARMWRQYAMAWDGRGTYDRRWLAQVLRVSRQECIRRARVNLYLARRLNRGYPPPSHPPRPNPNPTPMLPVTFTFAPVRGDLGTPLSQLSGRPGRPGYERFRAIAASWGYP